MENKKSRKIPAFWASCRIRTNDPEITNHVLWPTELKRHGRVSLPHRTATTYYPCYGQVLGGFARSWSYRTYPSAKLRLFSKLTKFFATFFLKIFIFLIFTITYQCFWTIFGQNTAISSQNCPQKIFLHHQFFFTSMRFFEVSQHRLQSNSSKFRPLVHTIFMLSTKNP